MFLAKILLFFVNLTEIEFRLSKIQILCNFSRRFRISNQNIIIPPHSRVFAEKPYFSERNAGGYTAPSEREI